MRISSDPSDPAYDHDKAARATVLLDGEPIDDLLTADEEAGIIVRFKRNEHGVYMIRADGTLQTETISGTVRIFFIP